MNPLVLQFVFGFLLFIVGLVLESCVISSLVNHRNMEGLRMMLRDGRFWGGWACLLPGTFIMMAPILPFIFR